MTKYWCGVVSREHIKIGENGGFCQVCHGKSAPLKRMEVGDGIMFYSPVTVFQSKEKCQKFTAIAKVIGTETYQFQMSPSFIPYRRDIEYYNCIETDIHPFLDQLEFTQGKSSWGYKFRFGHFELSKADFATIARAMLPDQFENIWTE